MHIAIPVFLCAVAVLTAACDKNVYYTVQQDVDETGWDMNDRLEFDVDVDDTLQLFDFYVDVRNSVHFPKANVFFFSNTTFPDGSVAYDTLECPLAERHLPPYGQLSLRGGPRHARHLRGGVEECRSENREIRSRHEEINV